MARLSTGAPLSGIVLSVSELDAGQYTLSADFPTDLYTPTGLNEMQSFTANGVTYQNDDFFVIEVI